MLVDASNRAAMDADEGDDQLLMGLDSSNAQVKPTATQEPAQAPGLLDLDMMMGGAEPAPVVADTQNNNMGDMMDLFGSAPTTAPSQPAAATGGGDLMDLLGGMGSEP